MENFSEIFFGLNPGDRVMVAYSGGVDSSYAAELCRNAGFQVETVTMSLFPEAEKSVGKAEESAKKAGFPHHTLDLSKDFREEIMHRCWLDYSKGLTPNPCAVCNIRFKFGRLREFALSRGCAAMVTGHYARIRRSAEGRIELRKGVCAEKDQSYFLFGVPAEALAYCRTPLGVRVKSDVKREAGALGLESAKAKESQDICFGGDSMPETLAALFPEPAAGGRFLDPSGKVLGRHRGIQFYTIGQRKGTGVALGRPAYIRSIDGATRDIVITDNADDLLTESIDVFDCNFTADVPERFECEVRTRYRSRAVPALVLRRPDGSCEVRFSVPVRAVAPGQAAVFYRNDLVLGGGWIGLRA